MSVHTFHNSFELASVASDEHFDLYLLDIIMPGLGGIETMREIKKINPKIWVAMVTAVVDEEVAKRLIQLGADDYIVKPIHLEFIGTYVMVKLIQLLN